MIFGSERDERLGSAPAVGAQPDALYTRYLRPVPNPQPAATTAHEVAFQEWANADTENDCPEIVARVNQLAVIAAAEQEFTDDDVFPPSPALRIKWRRVLAWSPILALAGLGAVTAARYVVHHPLAYWAVAFTAVYFACQVTPDGRP